MLITYIDLYSFKYTIDMLHVNIYLYVYTYIRFKGQRILPAPRQTVSEKFFEAREWTKMN